MTDINGLRYFEVDFDAEGNLNTASGQGDGGLQAAVAAGGITDLFVLSHGWNNGVDSARDLYQAMFDLLADQLGTHRSTSAAVGVIWPSLLFPDDDPATAPPVPSTGMQLAAALAPAFPTQQHNLATLGQLLDHRPQDSGRLTEFHTLATGLVTTPHQAVEDSGEAALLHADTETVFRRAALEMAPDTEGYAERLDDPFAVLWSGAREVLRMISYYEMKNRAGTIGQTGLGPMLAALNGPTGPPRINLAGHSFGARLVAYSLAGLPVGQTGRFSPVKSLSLIQGAFSHFTFASALTFDPSRSGGLAGMGDRVDGPLLATFTSADRALGWWYPTASRLAHQDAEVALNVPHPDFRWGAMGHDGYQQDPVPTTTLLAEAGSPYTFAPSEFYSLNANAVIRANQSVFSGAHSDIRHPEVTWAVVSAANLGKS